MELATVTRLAFRGNKAAAIHGMNEKREHNSTLQREGETGNYTVKAVDEDKHAPNNGE